MKHLRHPTVALLLLLLCLPEYSTSLLAQTTGTDNPIMIIRCRNFSPALKGTKPLTVQSKMMTGCPPDYIATMDGGCIPDCPALGGDTNFVFNPASGECEYTGTASGTFNNFCPGSVFDSGCDPCLSDGAGNTTDDFLDYDSALGACYKACFDGAVEFDLPTVDCENQLANGNVAIELCFRSADPNMPLQDGQQVAIADISNCLDDFGDDLFDLAQVMLDLNQNYGFGSALNGEICINFFANPNEQIIINFINQTDPAETPVCSSPKPTTGQWTLLKVGILLPSLGPVLITKKK